jgi:cytochrome b involved in lipid metabolism
MAHIGQRKRGRSGNAEDAVGDECHESMGLQSELEAASSAGMQIAWSELAKHNKKDDCWIAIDEIVYDVTTYLQKHPGGDELLINLGGQDATRSFVEAGACLVCAFATLLSLSSLHCNFSASLEHDFQCRQS